MKTLISADDLCPRIPEVLCSADDVLEFLFAKESFQTSSQGPVERPGGADEFSVCKSFVSPEI